MRRVIVMSMLLLVAMAGYCQETTKGKKKVQAGISLGYEFSYLKPTLSNWDTEGISNEINDLQVEHSGGFSLGILYQYLINEGFALRVQPLLLFEGGRLNYDLQNQENTTEDVRPIAIALPLHAVFTKVKADPTKGFSPLVFFGGQYILDIMNEEENSLLDFKKHSFSFDVGTGIYRQFEHFNTRLEFVYSLGLTNLLQSKDNIYHKALKDVSKDGIAVRLIFFGL